MIHNEAELVRFLIEAKQHTYAAGGAHTEPCRLGSIDLAYEAGEYRYLDSYFGGLDFIGEEAVWRSGQPVWGMNYYGWMLVEDVGEGFSECLKGALMSPPVEGPYRGPSLYRRGQFEYRCTWYGEPDRFEGREEILREGEPVYRLVFHGGRTRV